MLQITATELKCNLGKYLSIVGREDIRITKNGKCIALLSAPEKKYCWVDDITGVIPNAENDVKKYKSERLAQKYESLN
jgi:prevent-host-death family protein